MAGDVMQINKDGTPRMNTYYLLLLMFACCGCSQEKQYSRQLTPLKEETRNENIVLTKGQLRKLASILKNMEESGIKGLRITIVQAKDGSLTYGFLSENGVVPYDLAGNEKILPSGEMQNQ